MAQPAAEIIILALESLFFIGLPVAHVELNKSRRSSRCEYFGFRILNQPSP
jgi:hypothetical protein